MNSAPAVASPLSGHVKSTQLGPKPPVEEAPVAEAPVADSAGTSPAATVAAKETEKGLSDHSNEGESSVNISKSQSSSSGQNTAAILQVISDLKALKGSKEIEFSTDSGAVYTTVGGADKSFIAKGGMGIVYKVVRKDIDEAGKEYALKIFVLPEDSEPAAVRRAQREMGLMKAMAGKPNLVYSVDQGPLYVIMPLYEGGDLGQAVRKDPNMDLLKIMQIGVKSLRALSELHTANIESEGASGIIHRDFKPSNILLDKENEPHLSDYGIAKFLGQDVTQVSKSNTISGTVDYLSPEQALGVSSGLTPKSDIFSWGVAMYELLTGELPFRHNPDDAPVVRMHRASHCDELGAVMPPNAVNPSIPPDVNELLLDILTEPNPEERVSFNVGQGNRRNAASLLADWIESVIFENPVNIRQLSNVRSPLYTPPKVVDPAEQVSQLEVTRQFEPAA